MQKISISADPYHQRFVPIRRCRLLADVAAQVLGPGRVQVRWADWLANGVDMGAAGPDAAEPPPELERREILARYAALGRERLNGRAAGGLAKITHIKEPRYSADMPCGWTLLRGRHVHVDASGIVMPGTCAGIILGQADANTNATELWRWLERDWQSRPVVGVLAARGPTALAADASRLGFVPLESYASKCHLCWHVRKWLLGRARDVQVLSELGPRRLYDEERSGAEL
jgi:hypothetical protein